MSNAVGSSDSTKDAPTDEQIRALCDAATPLPWYANVDDLVGGWCVQNVDLPASQVNRIDTPHARYIADFVMTDDDAEFIAASRSLVSVLLARAVAAEAQLAEAQTAAQAWRERAEYDDGLISRIWDAVREYLPDAIGHNTLPEIVAGIARQRDGQHEIKDHLADIARKLTSERDAALVTLDKIRELHFERKGVARGNMHCGECHEAGCQCLLVLLDSQSQGS